ncbi:MAG TPA: ATP-binding protein [Bacteroidetes bacterium]|nr:ATP-binding protein [Bacteroidota bacterium]
MQAIQRHIQPKIEKWLFRGKVIIIYGARQVGKTTLAKLLLEKFGQTDGYFNCETPSVSAALENREPALLRRFIGNKKIVVFDEAQYVPNIGLTLKIFADTFPSLQIIATGSSSFELANRTSEPLTGRSLQFTLLPFSLAELEQWYNIFEIKSQLGHFLSYGLYPEIVKAPIEEARVLLEDLSGKYLYKDILAFENLKRSDVLYKLLKLLALQIGHEVSYHELASSLKINSRTVERYIDLLEKAFVVFRLTPLSRNLRKEISKKNKIYFYDVGIRNAIVGQYQAPELRTDKGSLWENFFIVERLKYLQNNQLKPKRYFWRTHNQQELDYIEESNDTLHAFEIKWKPGRYRVPPSFAKAYPNNKTEFVNTENFTSFLF